MQDKTLETAPEENEAIGEATTLEEQETNVEDSSTATLDVTVSDDADDDDDDYRPSYVDYDPDEGIVRPKKLDYSYTQNRELSWLQFDKRVLEEALDPTVPLFERMKFISIFCTNLDEFFMVRVGSLMDLSIIAPEIHENKTDMTPREQLEAIFAAVKPLVKLRDEVYHTVADELKKYDFKELDLEELSKKDRKFARDYYREFIRPVLSPQVVDERHPFPHLRNKELYIATVLTDKDKSQHLGIIPVPENIAPIISEPDNPLHFVRAEKLIAFHVKKIFDIYETSEPCIISVTRNADISFDEEKFSDDEGDYRLHVSRLLKKRNRLQPVRLEIEGTPEKALLTGLLKRLKLSKNQVYNYDAPINLGWAFGLERRVDAKQKRKLCYAPFVPRASSEFDINRSILKQIEERDRLLFYPYDSIDPFLRMLQEAAIDPDVLSIKITVYRLASESRVAQHLIEAAENGKEVTVLMELRARFDEANNIDWSARLEEAGCNIIYGMENYKCHSKVCLITKRSTEGVRYITQIGTGNYNEKTARLYTDLSVFTSDAGIGRDAVSFFQNMLIGNLNGNYEKLLVAPVAIKRTILRLIDREIEKGTAGSITLKANSVTERDIIDRLAVASQAGVRIRMNIRGICCMLPGIEGKTENVHVRSVVGQFLEHSRIFVFGEGDDMEMYVGSADLMTRNLCHRVEVAVPITTKPAREAIMVFLDKIFADNTKARTLEPNGEYVAVAESRDKDMASTEESFNVQEWCIEHPLQGRKRSPGSVYAQPSDTVASDVELGFEFEVPSDAASDDAIEESKAAVAKADVMADLAEMPEAIASAVAELPTEVAAIVAAALKDAMAAEDAVEDDAIAEDAPAEEAGEETAVDVEATVDEEVEEVEAVVEAEAPDQPEDSDSVAEETSVEEAVVVPSDDDTDEVVEEVVVSEVIEEPAAEEAADDEPAADEAATEETATDEPAVEEPAAETTEEVAAETTEEVADEAPEEVAPLNFEVDFDTDIPGASGIATDVNPAAATGPMEKIIDSQIEVDEVSSQSEEAGSVPRDFDLAFLTSSKEDEKASDSNADVEDVVFEQVGSMPIETSEPAVDETPTDERLARERAFASGAPHVPHKPADKSAEEEEAKDEAKDVKTEEPEEKKGFFKGLFS